MASEPTPPRMSAERLEEIREIVAQNQHGLTETERRVGYPGQREYELLAHIDTLSAELEAARATALEEAANIATAQYQTLATDYRLFAVEIATRIRALKVEP